MGEDELVGSFGDDIISQEPLEDGRDKAPDEYQCGPVRTP